MNRISKILIILNIIVLFLIIVKIYNQNVSYTYELSDTNSSKEEIRNNLYNELKLGVGKYSTFENGKKINISDKIKEGQVLPDGLKVEDYKIECENEYTSINAIVVNDSSEKKGEYYAYLNVYDDNENKVFNIIVYIDKVLPNSSTNLSTSITADISNIYRCELEKIEEVL